MTDEQQSQGNGVGNSEIVSLTAPLMQFMDVEGGLAHAHLYQFHQTVQLPIAIFALSHDDQVFRFSVNLPEAHQMVHDILHTLHNMGSPWASALLLKIAQMQGEPGVPPEIEGADTDDDDDD